MKLLKKLLSVLLVLVMLFSLAACGENGSASNSSASPSPSSSANSSSSSNSSSTGSSDKKITLGFAQVGSESEWRTANTEDIKRAAEAAGITLQFSDAQQKQENQIKAIRSFIASEVDVISFCPIVATGWDTVLQEAKDAGIPVILVDRGVSADPSLYVTHICADALAEGANAFNWIHGYIKEKGKTPRSGDVFNIAILEGTVGSSVAADRLKGFKDAIAAVEDADKYNILFSQTGEYTRAKGKEVMESFLKSGADKIDILFAANDDMALGAIQAIEAAGLKPGEDIIIVSIDAAKGAFNAMIEGKMNCAVEHTPNFGDLLMETAKKIVAGEEVPSKIMVEEGIFPADIAAQELPNRTY
ncbi:MAG: ABC transporter substrate-binding protein [Clostridiaceae bacterium]|nr:ABC transporter substrate-binding protein [Clostridiaceae bacterium]